MRNRRYVEDHDLRMRDDVGEAQDSEADLCLSSDHGRRIELAGPHRPHRGISNARPLHPLPEPITDRHKITHLHVRRRDRLGGILHEYEHAA